MTLHEYPEMHWTPERVSRFWDWQSQYPETYFTYQFGEEIVRSLHTHLAGRRRILDYGCGVGYLIPHLCKLGSEVYGADFSPKSVHRTNQRVAGTASFQKALLVSDLMKQGLEFDAVIAVEIIEHLYDPDLDSMLSSILAMLSPEGVAVFTTPNNEDREKNMILCPATGETFHRWQHVRSWDAVTLPERLRSAGYSVVAVQEMNLAMPKSRNPYLTLKRLAKRLLLGDAGNPHLVCIASRDKSITS